MSLIPDFIIPHIWWIAALGCSVVTASAYLAGQYSKMDGNLTVFWRGVIPFFVTSPLLLLIEIPTSPYFYLATFTTALIASYTDTKNMNGAIQYGAGVSLRIRPYALWLVFLGWLIFSTSFREDFFADSERAIGIGVALLVVVISTSYMTKCPVSRASLMFFLPVILGGACIDILNKTAMNFSPVLGGIVMYVWVQGVIISGVCFFKRYFSKEKSVTDFFKKRTLYIGIGIGFLFVVMSLMKNTAMTYTVNPAYVSAIVLCAPVWTSLFYRLKGEKDKANEFVGLIVVASSIMLVILASSQ